MITNTFINIIKILKYISDKSLSKISYEEIGDLIDVESPTVYRLTLILIKLSIISQANKRSYKINPNFSKVRVNKIIETSLDDRRKLNIYEKTFLTLIRNVTIADYLNNLNKNEGK